MTEAHHASRASRLPSLPPFGVALAPPTGMQSRQHDPPPTPGTPPASDVAVRASLGDGDGRTLLCARCGRAITTTAARIAVDGQHEHLRTNPHGYEHRFGCFARATGLVSRGVPSRQFTWFAGYWWHVQDCADCGAHLGWLFFRPEDQFYGLILDALVEAGGPAPSA